MNDLDGTLAAAGECIEYYPQDAASYDARYLAAEAHLERGELSAAEALLRQNLTNDLLTPESREWRDSLFLLGKVLHADGRYEETIQRLQEAVSRYPNTPQSVEARYLIAEAFREAAKVPQQKLESDTIETARIAHQKQKNQYLAGAIENYQQVQAVLNQRQEQRELTPLEKAILRNSYFALGNAQFDLGRYEDALQTYSAASNRYQHDPEVLEAFVEMASCQRRLNHPLEARGALQQAKVVLDQLPKDAPFTAATNFTRREWTEFLDWLINL
jgi:TolA-binding protein